MNPRQAWIQGSTPAHGPSGSGRVSGKGAETGTWGLPVGADRPKTAPINAQILPGTTACPLLYRLSTPY